MDPYDPILDQPQVIEFDESPGPSRYRQANQDLYFDADANSDLFDLHWPWADSLYARSIRMNICDPQGEDMVTLVTRYYAGYQETILGNEGMIISKRLAAPLGSHYDRSVMWMLECQAEGDRLLRLDIEIDWGEPLTQRIVDGLLVAQSNPRKAQGIYKQRNADKTCVMGNPQGRPSAYEFDESGRASLTYYVLVNGIVEVPLLLTVSDVGEQVAWSGFLALRDAEREFEASVKQWDQTVKQGRLWTSDPALNRAVQAGRLCCVQRVQRMRTGLAPISRRTTDAPSYVKCTDAFDVTISRNMLAHLRRLAEKSKGRVPVEFPVRPKDLAPDPGIAVAGTNAAYLEALCEHLRRHPDAELLQKHFAGAALCAETLVRMRWERPGMTEGAADVRHAAARGLQYAAELASAFGDDANAARWRSEATALGAESGLQEQTYDLAQWAETSGWQFPDSQPWGFAEPREGVRLAGEAVWSVCGLEWHEDAMRVYPTREPMVQWWALVDMPIRDTSITMVWDGVMLHSTVPVQSDQPVAIHDAIRVKNTEEHDFDLRFDMIDVNNGAGDDKPVIHSFHPVFDRGSDSGMA